MRMSKLRGLSFFPFKESHEKLAPLRRKFRHVDFLDGDLATGVVFSLVDNSKGALSKRLGRLQIRVRTNSDKILRLSRH